MTKMITVVLGMFVAVASSQAVVAASYGVADTGYQNDHDYAGKDLTKGEGGNN